MPSRNLPLPNILSAKRPKEKTVISLIFLLLVSTFNPAWKNDAYARQDAEGVVAAVTGGLSLVIEGLNNKPKSFFGGLTEATQDMRVLDGVSETQEICICSNVPATVYVNKKKVGNTPFCGKIEKGLTTEIVLATEKYKPTKVPLEKHIHPYILGSSSEVTPKLSGRPTTFERISSNVTSTLSPVSGDFTLTSQGRWIEYAPNSYFVDFSSSQIKTKLTKKNRNIFKWQIMDFALKSFYEIKAGKDEYVKAMAKLSGLLQMDVRMLVQQHSTPESFAKEITRLSFE